MYSKFVHTSSGSSSRRVLQEAMSTIMMFAPLLDVDTDEHVNKNKSDNLSSDVIEVEGHVKDEEDIDNGKEIRLIPAGSPSETDD